MTSMQNDRCHAIIHSAAAAAAAGNLVPVPGVGLAADLVAMTAMTMTLASVFGGSLTEEIAKGMAIAAIKNSMLKQPLRILTKELSKLVPFLGQLIAPAFSVTMLEAAGWAIATELDRKFC